MFNLYGHDGKPTASLWACALLQLSSRFCHAHVRRTAGLACKRMVASCCLLGSDMHMCTSQLVFAQRPAGRRICTCRNLEEQLVGVHARWTSCLPCICMTEPGGTAGCRVPVHHPAALFWILRSSFSTYHVPINFPIKFQTSNNWFIIILLNSSLQ